MAARNSTRSMTATPPIEHDLRISHIAYDRVHTKADDSGTWFPLPQLRRLASDAADWRVGAPLLRRADQPQPSRHHRDRCTGNPRALQSRQRRCRRAGSELPGLPSDHQPGRPASGGQRHFHRRDGVRQGHRRTRRGAAVSVLGFSARQFGGQAARSGIAGLHAGTRIARAGNRARAQTTVQSPLRWSADASWKRDYSNASALSAEELARLRREFDAQKEIARGLRESAA